MTQENKPRLAADIGGTFTDIAIELGDDVLTAKTLMTAEHPVDGVLRGLGYELEDTIDRLLARNIESIAVCLLNSYANPAHELLIAKALRWRAPNLPASLSSVGKYDRLCTTVANAYIKPLMAEGDSPTVADADVIAGYIDPVAFAEGRLTLQPSLSRVAIERDICVPLQASVVAGADGIAQTVDEAMANAARMHAVEQGANLADCTMVAFGGNGPLPKCIAYFFDPDQFLWDCLSYFLTGDVAIAWRWLCSR